jgi:opacity protein-like surface antigen
MECVPELLSMVRKLSWLCSFVGAHLCLSLPCSADLGGRGFSIGALFGSASYNYGLGAQVSYGGLAHYKIIPNFGVGLTFTYAHISSTYSDIASSVINSIHFDGDLQFHFLAPFNGLWAGARLGYWNQSASFSVARSTTVVAGSYNTSSNQSGFEWGPAVGYDFAITKNFLVGGDWSYLSVILIDPVFSANQILGTVKFYF